MNAQQPMNVEALMELAFEGSGRTWRSFEYRDGVRAVLEFWYHKRPPVPPDNPGSARCDAFLAGMEEGWALLSRFGGARAHIPPLVQHAWIEEQRSRVIEGLGSAVRRSRNEAPLTQQLYVIDAVAAQLPARPPRYPWEYAKEKGGASQADRHPADSGTGVESGTAVSAAIGSGRETAGGGEVARDPIDRAEET